MPFRTLETHFRILTFSCPTRTQLKSDSLDRMEEHQFGSSEHEYDPLRYELVFNLVEHPHIFLRLILYQVTRTLVFTLSFPHTFNPAPLTRLKVLPLVWSFLYKYGMQLLATDSEGGDCKATIAALMQSVARLFNATKIVEVGGTHVMEAKEQVPGVAASGMCCMQLHTQTLTCEYNSYIYVMCTIMSGT